MKSILLSFGKWMLTVEAIVRFLLEGQEICVGDSGKISKPQLTISDSFASWFGHLYLTSGELQCQHSLHWAKKAADPLSDFTVHLYNAVSNKNAEKNIVFSPVSVSLALALLKSGADGDTRIQMRYVLVKRGSNESDANNIYQALRKQLLLSGQAGKANLKIIGGLFYKPRVTLKPEFLENARRCFKSTVENCDFKTDVGECRNRINEFVANGTANKIPVLFSEGSINSDTVSVLANAVYFKAPWYETFPASLVTTATFYRFGKENDKQSVQYLNNEDQYLYSQTNAVSIVGIPYKGNDFYMYIILPKKRDGLEEMEKTFTGTELMFLINRTTEREVDIKIPKFKVRTRIDLKPILTSLGLKDMFSNSANFHRMTDSNIFVDAAVHETFITVNEKGTEAAAATGLSLRPMSARPIPIPFVANHPFFYAIVHQPTRAIIFAGKILYIE